MERRVAWTTLTGEGTERLTVVRDGWRALPTAVAEGAENGTPFREGAVRAAAPRGRSARAAGRRPGRWATVRGDPRPGLDGRIDADISATPFTNTLPIRRLGLRTGESAALEAAYVAVPDPSVEPDACGISG